jgi:uncharacterized protein YjbJ (UPF0337 family)
MQAEDEARARRGYGQATAAGSAVTRCLRSRGARAARHATVLAALIHSERTFKEISMNKDQIKGRVDQATGKIKEEVGKATGDTATTIRGKAEKAGGKARAISGDVKEEIKKTTR